MVKPLSGCRICVINPRTWAAKKWSRDNVEKWVKSAGGVLQKEFEERGTTHLVVEEQAWKNKVRWVQLALDVNDNGGKVYIVTPEWLEGCLAEQRKHRERAFLWEKIDQEAAAAEKRKKHGKQANEGGGEEGGEEGEDGPRSHQAMLGEVLQEGTEDYVGDHDRRILEAENAEREKAKKERDEAETRRKEQAKQAAEQQRKAHAELMRKSAKKGRGEVFNANFHVFKDSTGFEYDCTLTKVDTLTNRNERIVLTIFESNTGDRNNDSLPTYATNMHFAGTGKQPRNNILVTLGSNFFTAIRMWRKAFKEKTGVDWDDRIKAHNERVRDRARDGDTPGLYSTRRGENGDIKSKTRAAEDAVPFEKRLFEYMPPLHDARGWLPDGKEEVPEVLRQIRAKTNEHRDRTEQWMMSGGLGTSSPRQSIENARVSNQIDLTVDEPADQLGGYGNGTGDSATGASLDAATMTAGAVNGGLSNGTDPETYLGSLLAGTHEGPAQDDVFNVDDLIGQQQQDFVFDQDGADFTIASAGTEATGMGVSPGNEASLPNQTQFALELGHDLLSLEQTNNADEGAASGLVVVPESEQLEAAAGVEKRKRDEGETEGEEPAAKRFLGEMSESAEAAA